MRAQSLPDFAVGHEYPKGQAPSDEHPERFGRMTLHRCFRIDGIEVVVHSTERQRDGWSYNVVEERARPAWVGYYHHKPSGKRLRAANSPNALQLAQVLDAL